jgi:phosphatidylserine/phosphatidylglycerophosphate/cardiolipin synthase-like enzyme
MKTVLPRQFLSSSSGARREIRELLQTLFVGEIIAPSRCIWLVSPWLRDIEVIDNRSGAFRALDSDWERRWIRLSDVLRNLLGRGCHVVVATRPLEDNLRVITTFRDALRDQAPELVVHTPSELHAKGLLGDTFCLSGSMNFTFSGLDYQTEMLTLQTDPAEVGRLRLSFHEEYGGRL